MARASRAFVAIPERSTVNIHWLVRLRWAQIIGQAATVMVAHFLLGLSLMLAPLVAINAFALASNLFIEFRYVTGAAAKQRRVDDWQVALVMALDIALLTALLFFSGGPQNPFGFLYVVQIALAAVALRATWTWLLVGLSFTAYGVLVFGHHRLALAPHWHMVGMWVALGVASAFVVHFLLRIVDALAHRESELADARSLAARQERIASLATMAAGAAHELSTPLGTVALAAKELERALAKTPCADNEALVADARLIREQVGRCRVILDRMAQGAGTIGEGLVSVRVEALIADCCQGVRLAPAVNCTVPPEVATTSVRIPKVAVAQALRAIVTNAQDATLALTPHAPPAVQVTVTRQQNRLCVAVVDQGVGMPADVLARVGEPFYTTKSPGQGMGLGLFLARAVIEGVGGSLEYQSRQGVGTTAQIELPVDAKVIDSRGELPPKR